MSVANICIIIAIVAYLILMVIIGVICSKKNNSVDDFYLGGRQLGPLVTAMSAEASDMSGWLLMGMPGLAYLCGIAEASWTAIGLAIGTYLNWLIVAKRLRNYSSKIGAITIPDFFGKRFKDNTHVLMFASALLIIIFFIPYTASGFSTCGKLFSSLFGLDYHVAVIVSAIVIVLYTTLGGFLAASTTDFIQAIIMTIALIAVLCFGINTAGGWNAVAENAKSIPHYLSLTSTTDGAGNMVPFGGSTIVSTLAWGLGYFGMPHILLRFMAIKDPNKIKTSRRVASIWVVIAMSVAIIIGIVGLAMSKTESSMVLKDSETIIVAIAALLSKHGVVFALLAGLILAGILASTMSTADSQLLAAASAISQDLMIGSLRLKISEKVKMIAARTTVIAIAILGVVFAWNPDSSVFRIVSFAWAGFGASFGPLMLFSLFWKRTNKWGAMAGMISGGITVIAWHYAQGGIFNLYELLPAFIVSSIFIVVVSLLTKAPEQEIIDEFESAKSNS
ncbi:MAG: sodium/proline symporter PutP [Anaerotruncus sp.]|nr:sodium/proline symporter PutP [Anaerotruncus sp.]